MNDFCIGQMNTMRIVKEVEFGLYLDGGEDWGEVLLPKSAVPDGVLPNDEIDVFLYFDSEDRLIATTIQPLAMVGDFAALTVVDQNKVGTFLDWQIPGKDLFLPFKEQTRDLELGEKAVVFVSIDPRQGRIVASMKVEKFVSDDLGDLKPTNQVDLLIARKTDMGYVAVINGLNLGLLYHNEIFEPLKEGDIRVGYIKALREDSKVDLSLQKIGYKHIEDSQGFIIDQLKLHGGFISITDKSSPEEIQKMFSMSKKSYKKIIGALFKKRLISIEVDGIRLLG